MPADTEDDARQARTLHTSTAAAIAALAGAGMTVATGGAAAPAVAAAVAAGAAAGGATYAVSSAANDQEQAELDAAGFGGPADPLGARTHRRQAFRSARRSCAVREQLILQSILNCSCIAVACVFQSHGFLRAAALNNSREDSA